LIEQPLSPLQKFKPMTHYLRTAQTQSVEACFEQALKHVLNICVRVTLAAISATSLAAAIFNVAIKFAFTFN